MKKLLVTLVCVLLAAALCGGALAIDIQVPTLTDVLVTHRAILTDEGDNYKEYVVVFANGDGALTQMNDETHFDKALGVTVEYLQTMDIDSFYPGFSKMSFADTLVYEEGDHITLVIRFKNLDDPANAKAMEDADLLIRGLGNSVFNADNIADALIQNGGHELSLTEIGEAGLNFDIG